MSTSSSAEDLEGIVATVEEYFEAMHRCEPERVLRAFHPDAKIVGPDDGALAQMTRESFAALVERQKPSPAERGEPRDMGIVSVDVAGDVATAKVRDRYLGRIFVDYLAMVRLDGRWQIYTKLWHVERKLED